MIASGVVFLSMGVPAIALGLYLRAHPEAMEPRSVGKKTKKQKKKKKDGDDGSSRKGGLSLILGGVLMCLIGAGFLAAHFMR